MDRQVSGSAGPHTQTNAVKHPVQVMRGDIHSGVNAALKINAFGG